MVFRTPGKFTELKCMKYTCFFVFFLLYFPFSIYRSCILKYTGYMTYIMDTLYNQNIFKPQLQYKRVLLTFQIKCDQFYSFFPILTFTKLCTCDWSKNYRKKTQWILIISPPYKNMYVETMNLHLHLLFDWSWSNTCENLRGPQWTIQRKSTPQLPAQ